jgi:hypothetical protein
VSIRDQLQENMLSQKIFHLESWLSKDENDKRHVFDDYSDYKHSDNFYQKLKERDNDLSNKNIGYDELKNIMTNALS